MTTDSADDVVSFLNSGWNINTGGVKPTIALVETFKRIDLGGDQDVIVVYMSSGNTIPIGLGYSAEQTIQPVSIDIRTTTSKARLIIILTEIKRIIHANRRKAQNGLHDLIVFEKVTNLNNRTIKLYRYIVEISIRDYNLPISG